MNLYRTGFRTSSSKTKQCAPPKAGLHSEPRIHWRKRAKQRGRALRTPTHYFFQNHLVLLRCLYYTKLEPIFKINKIKHTSVPRVLKHLCAVAQSFLKEKVRGNAERLKYWEMSRSRKNGLGFAKLFCGREDSQNRS